MPFESYRKNQSQRLLFELITRIFFHFQLALIIIHLTSQNNES